MTNGEEALPHRKWYAIQTLSNQEAKVQRTIGNCASAAGVRGYVGKVLFPTENVSEVKNGRKYIKVRKLYPGYLFAELELHLTDGKLNQELWQFIRNISGVSGFVGGEVPVALKPTEVDEILYQIEVKNNKISPKVVYEPEMMVRITDGVFKDHTGRVLSVDLGKGILNVSLELFGRSTPVGVEFWQVTKVGV